MAGILAGIKVVEFSEVIAGPWGGMMLADLGADVVKVEPLEGDPWRATLPFAPGEGRWFLSLNRGKRGLAVDLRRPEGRALAHRLVAEADVVVVNYRPDTPGNLGIDWETLSSVNPRDRLCGGHRLRPPGTPRPPARLRPHHPGGQRVDGR